MSAVERGDMETAQSMVDEAARRAWYKIKVYHGSPAFGFTTFDLSKMDDKMSIFTAKNLAMAQTYSGAEGVTPLTFEGNRKVKKAFIIYDITFATMKNGRRLPPV